MSKATRSPDELTTTFVPVEFKSGTPLYLQTLSDNVGSMTFGDESKLRQLAKEAKDLGITNLVFYPAGIGANNARLESVAKESK